eukprot:141478-Hanusia_phi.AAC.1
MGEDGRRTGMKRSREGQERRRRGLGSSDGREEIKRESKQEQRQLRDDAESKQGAGRRSKGDS